MGAASTHARRRSLERHGISLNRTTSAEITAQIRAGRAKFLGATRDNADRLRYAVTTGTRRFVVIVSASSGVIVTVL